MARMIRKQVVLEPELDAELAAHAERTGASQSEIVREALRAYLEDAAAQAERDAQWEWLQRHWRDSEYDVLAPWDGRMPTREERNERPGLRRFERDGLRGGPEGSD